MAEESSRPAAEDSEEEEEEEEGEEAAEAPNQDAATPPVKEKTSNPVRVSPPRSSRSESSRSVSSHSVSSRYGYSRHGSSRSGSSRSESKPRQPTSPSSTGGMNVFANDGSFLELFKKKMEASPTETKEDTKPEPDKRKPVSFVGRRRGGAKLALKTGMVAKKPKVEEEEEVVSQKGGAWAQYMAEVKKYKAHQCSDDDKTRPLVK